MNRHRKDRAPAPQPAPAVVIRPPVMAITEPAEPAAPPAAETTAADTSGSIAAEQDDMIRRALAAYWRNPDRENGVEIEPVRSLCGIEVHHGLNYVVIRNRERVLAGYRVRTSGLLKRMRRWPPYTPPVRQPPGKAPPEQSTAHNGPSPAPQPPAAAAVSRGGLWGDRI